MTAPTEYVRIICPNCEVEIPVKHAGPLSQLAICKVCESIYQIIIAIIPIDMKRILLN